MVKIAVCCAGRHTEIQHGHLGDPGVWSEHRRHAEYAEPDRADPAGFDFLEQCGSDYGGFFCHDHPAARPDERILAEEFGISRPALREVLKALSLLGITVSVHGGANYIANDLHSCLTEPLSIIFQMYNSKIQDALQLRGALESKAAFLAAQNCTPLDAAELQLIIARLDSTQDEKIRGDLDRDLHLKIAQISANPLILSVLNASAQITENMIVGIRSYLMQKNNDAPEIDSQHTRLVQAITNNDAPLAEKVMNEHMHTIEYLLNEITSDNLTISDNVQQP